ncbi:MAG: biosynthetic-type acetolactate synthase large subunit [Oscillospiraceae bacterium]|nr:biosynthetic-type acetolactate synthase large subunit [Oscillospiraceae bacterium]
MMLSGAQIVIEELVAQGVNTVFGYPGGNVIDIYDELYKNSNRLRHILTAHEQGAAHAADAYARISGRASAVIATSGPGATNLVTGIANAYLDSIPVVFITGNVPVSMLGRDSFQEIDVLGLTLPIVKHSYVVRNVAQLSDTLREAFRIASSGRKGPVLVDIPKCVQTDTWEWTAKSDILVDIKDGKAPITAMEEDDINFQRAIETIEKSQRPFIYSGGGVSAARAGDMVVELSKLINAPVGLSLMGLGSIPHSYELNLGMSGMQGRYASNMAKAESDLIIALGVRFSDRATCNIETYAKNATIIHVEIDAAEIGKNVVADIGLWGDINDILPKLIKNLKAKKNEQWLNRINELVSIGTVPSGNDFTAKNIIERINNHCDDDTIIATDVGQHQMWVAQNYRFEKPRKLVTSGGLGAMGFGLGAAIGASLASGGKRVVLFTGDGSFGMNLIELATAVSYEIPITIVIMNNSTLGMVRQMQTQFYSERYSQTTLNRKTDFSALAKAFGASGYKADDLSQLDTILAGIQGSGVHVIDCIINIDEKVLPYIPLDGGIEDMLME